MAARKKKAPKVEPPKLVDLLTPAQRAIVQHKDGPLLAGSVAGSGKTTCMVERVAHLVEYHGARLSRICIVAFNVSAAEDLNKKLKKRLPGVGLEDDPARTLHSLALLVYRSEESNRSANYGNVEALWNKAIREAAASLGIQKPDVDLVKAFSSKVRNDYLPVPPLPFSPLSGDFDLSKVHTDLLAAADIIIEKKRDPRHGIEDLIRLFYAADNARRAGRVEGANGFPFATFDDILWEAARIVEHDEDIRQIWQQRYDYIIVDEAQDLCEAQWQLIELLASGHRNLVVVGDAGQALYSFRQARPEHLLSFAERWGCGAVYMEENFRSGSDILDCGNRVLDAMAPNDKLPMHLKPTREIRGFVGRLTSSTSAVEAAAIANLCAEQKRRGREWRDMAILIRLNAQSKDIELEFFRQKVPLRMVSGTSFFGLKEAKAMLAYFRLILGKAEEDDLYQALTNPSRYLGRAFVDSVARVDKSDGDWAERIERCDAYHGRARDAAFQFVEQIKEWRGSMLRGATPAQLLERIIDRTQYVQWHRREQAEGDESSSFTNTMARIRSFAEGFDTVEVMLTIVDEMRAQQRAAAQSRNAVSVITIHKCVSPETLVDTDRGTTPISLAHDTGTVATTAGMRQYQAPVRYAKCKMLRMTTRYGYEISVTSDHGLMSWDGSSYVPVPAATLRVGDFLRLKLGTERRQRGRAPRMPLAPGGLDIRTVRHTIPKHLTEEVAEFLGLMVADGTVFRSGFRTTKADLDVIDRFGDLCCRIFGPRVHATKWYVPGKRTGWYNAEVCSVMIADWLRSVGGLSPHKKAIPETIWQTSRQTQVAFLRGLFEDATVNIKDDGRMDHIAFTTKYRDIGFGVQQLLLRHGIITSRFKVRMKTAGRLHDAWRVDAYGQQAAVFASRIGFVSARKNRQSNAAVSPETNTLIPMSKTLARALPRTATTKFDRANAVSRGYVSRHVARKFGLSEDLAFHHDQIEKIERYVGDAMCIEVPGHGRFLQNGFDGCNSKGLEYPVTFIPGMVAANWPVPWGTEREELRCFYVAVTRARDECWISTYTHGDDISGEPVTPSPYLRFVPQSTGAPTSPALPASEDNQLALI